MSACPNSVSVIDIEMDSRNVYAFKSCLIKKVSCSKQ